jgi:ribosomal protein S18 acetylase RimI-like enzyme
MTSTSIVAVRQPAGPDDEHLLRILFGESRPDLAALPSELRADLVDLQFRAQRRQYIERYPDARYDVIVVGSDVVGQIVVAASADSLRIVDITVSHAVRGTGIGSAVVLDIIDEAERLGRAVGLSVWSENVAARRFYERLGFVVTEPGTRASGGYVEMRRDVTGEVLT